MLAYVAETTDYRAVARRPGRLAATVAFQPLGTLAGRRVWVPAPYRDLLEALYAGAGLARSLEAGDSAPGRDASSLHAALHGERGVLSLRVRQAGPDLPDVVTRELAAADAAVVHVDLTLDDPGIDSSVASLRALGFLFCAVLPEYGRSDVLRLQRLKSPGAADFEPDLLNATARSLCEFIRGEACPGANPTA
jgi:hypothetical protein